MSCGGGKSSRAAAEMDSGQRPVAGPESAGGQGEIMENMDTEVSFACVRACVCARARVCVGV